MILLLRNMTFIRQPLMNHVGSVGLPTLASFPGVICVEVRGLIFLWKRCICFVFDDVFEQ